MTLALTITVASASAVQKPRALQGVVDLSTWDFADGHVSLEGEWELYWAHWLDPLDPDDPAKSVQPMYATVPGGWANTVSEGVPPPHGFGTYRLRVVLEEERGPLSIRLRGVNSAFDLWVNGHQLVRHGVPHQEATLERPAGGTVIVGLGAGHTELDIILHVSNHTFRSGGLSSSVVLGDSTRLLTDFKRSLTINVILIASLFVIGLYHFGIWAIRPGFLHALFLGLFCLVLSLRMAMMDQAPITFFVPHLSREWMLKVEYLGFYLGGGFLALFLHAMYPNEVKRQPVYVVVLVSLAFSIAVALTPGRINSRLLPYYEVFALAELIYLLVALVVAVRRERHGASLLFAATLLFFLVFIHDLLYFMGLFGTRQLVPIAMLVLVLAYSLTLAKRFINELERQRILSEQNVQLVDTVRRQVDELKESRRLMHEREENTRRSLADLLHGTVQSRLLSAGHFLQKAVSTLGAEEGDQKAQSVLEYLRKVAEHIDHSRQEVRDISHVLHPTLINMGLVPAIRTLLQRFDGQFETELIVTGALQTRPAGDEVLDKRVRLVAYRIVEEALSNVVKHAQATRVRVTMDVTGDRLTFEVSDDGKGMAQDQAGRGVGLDMIATRIEELSGSFEFDSRPGAGTRVRVQLPIRTG